MPDEYAGSVTEPELRRALSEVLAPLIEADTGEIWLVEASEKRVSLHLGGKFSGCPGNQLVETQIIRPLVLSIAPKAQIQVTSGALVPDSAEKLSNGA